MSGLGLPSVASHLKPIKFMELPSLTPSYSTQSRQVEPKLRTQVELQAESESRLTLGPSQKQHIDNIDGRLRWKKKKKPYKELTLEEKVHLIRLAESNGNMSQASIAERYSIAKSNVCRILQRRSEYLQAYESAGFAGNRKRKLRGNYLESEGTHNSGQPISKPLTHLEGPLTPPFRPTYRLYSQ